SLRQAIDRLAGDQAGKIPHRIAQDLLLISDNDRHLAAIGAQLGAGSSSTFASEIAQRYERGVNWLAAVDCASVSSGMGPARESRLLGLLNMRYLFFEQRSSGGRDENEA